METLEMQLLMRNAQCLVIQLLNALCDSDNECTARHLTELLHKGAREQQNVVYIVAGK